MSNTRIVQELRQMLDRSVSVILMGCMLTFCGIAEPAEPTIVTPVFTDPVQSFTAPVQTGTGRRATTSASGLYRVPDETKRVYSLGRNIRILRDHLVFVRGVDDFYTSGNVVWSGALQFQGEPGTVPPPMAEGIVGEDGSLVGRFRAEQDEAFQHNYLKDCAPNWYFPKAFDLIGVRKDEEGDKHPNPVRVEVFVSAPTKKGRAVVRVALNSNAPKEKDNSLSVRLNGTDILSDFVWTGPGYRIIELDVDASNLQGGVNTIELLGDASYIKHLDWVEIETAAKPGLRNGALVVEANAATAFQVPGSRYAIDITEFGSEQTVSANDNGWNLQAGHLYYFANDFDILTFGPELELAVPQTDGANYLAVGLQAMLPALDPLLERKQKEGLKTAAIAFEDIVNVYNGGMYGPSGIVSMLQQFKPEYLLLAGSFHRDSRGRAHEGTADAPWNPGIPAQVRHADQLTVSDDIYMLDGTVKVGRVPALTRNGLAAWAAKAARYSPPDNIVLLAGENKDVDFSHLQRDFLRRFPAAFIEADGADPKSVRKQLFDTMHDGTSMVVYQGHAQSWEIDKGLLDKSHAAAMPASSWILSTCNGGYYHADFDVYLRDWMTSAEGGCVNAVAAASVGIADQQDQLIRVFLPYAAKNPDIDWGGMMHHLKRNLPYPEKVMNDPDRPEFIRKSIARDRKTVDAYSFFGDPAARVLASTRRTAEIQRPANLPKKGPIPPGPATLPLLLSGPWDDATLALLSVTLRKRGPNEVEWRKFPLDSPLQSGANTITFDSAAFDFDGGVFELRVIEHRPNLPETVWTQARITQEGLMPAVPRIMVRQGRPRAEPDAEPDPDAPLMTMCVARAIGAPQNMRVTETQFQIRDNATPDEIVDDTGWLDRPSYVKPSEEVPESYEIRARMKKYRNEGEWSEWTSMIPKPRKNAQQGNQQKVQTQQKPVLETSDASVLLKLDLPAFATLDTTGQSLEGVRTQLIDGLELRPDTVLEETMLSRLLREADDGDIDWTRWFLLTTNVPRGRVDLLDALVDRLQAHPLIQHAEADHDAFGWKPHPADDSRVSNTDVAATVLPDDPLFAQQYYHRLIETPQAWTITTGSKKVSVAVLDAGIALPKNDLDGRAERGYDFLQDSSEFTESGTHGASILSLIAANGNNGVGIAGMDWECRIIPVNMVEGGVSVWAQAIEFAVREGADIINISGKLEMPAPSAILDAALQYAADEGVVIVASAGNQNREGMAWPASSTHVIAVGATDGFQHRWQDPRTGMGSNFGPGLDIVAPGAAILALDANGEQTLGAGTSAATALVSGTCSLMLAANPSLTPPEIREILHDTADKIGPKNLWSNGYCEPFGHGRLNAYAAVAKAANLNKAA